MTPRNPQSGITLLETMIGLLIMAMMALLFSGTFGNSIRVLGRSGVLTDELEQAASRHDLRLWLEAALIQSPPDDIRPIFSGSSTGLTALVLPTDGLFWAGVATEVSLDSDGSIVAEGQNSKREPIILRSRLLPNGQVIRVSYWGKTAGQPAPKWHAEWPISPLLPILIKIEFLTQGRSLPPLTIRLAKSQFQSEMSLSSLVPPALPSRP